MINIQNYRMTKYQLVNNSLRFKGNKGNDEQDPSTTKTVPVPAEIAISQLVKKGNDSTEANSNLAKVPDSVEEMKARFIYNTPANLDELKGIVKFIENSINSAAGHIAKTEYIEYTNGLLESEPKFTVYEPDEYGKYQITKQSKDPDYNICMSGKYDHYYDEHGRLIGTTLYDSRTNVREHTWIDNGISIRKDYNPDGSVKGYLINDHKGKFLEYDAKGEVTEIRISDLPLPVKNTGEELYDIYISRVQDQTSSFMQESKWYTDENGNTVVEFIEDKYIYKGQVDYVDGLVNIVQLGKAIPPKTEMSPEKAKILANAGFTEEVIDDLKLEAGVRYSSLIDEVLDMVEYLEAEIANGTPITKNLVEKTINRFSPGASGGSAACQRSILFKYWNKSDKMEEAYK